MSYLLLSASPYKNDETTNKKRISTIRRNTKYKTAPDDRIIGLDENFREGYESMSPPNMEDLQTVNENRNVRINDILDKITSNNDTENNKLGNFKPIEHPTLNVKKDLPESDATSKAYVPAVPSSYVAASNAMKSGDFSYAGNTAAKENSYSNYNQSYETPPTLKLPPYILNPGAGRPAAAAAASGVNPYNDGKLMERINYMIHLLEEQRDEKTSNITEEFILYTFLGVFIIYIVDSFARSGKYTR